MQQKPYSNPYAGDKKPSMLRRADWHDYRDRSMYMITLTTNHRSEKLLGEVTGDANAPKGSLAYPHLEPTVLGKAVFRLWYAIEHYHPEVTVVALQLMPDHLHGILFVREATREHLGHIIGGFKKGCNDAYRALTGREQAGEGLTGGPLVSEGSALTYRTAGAGTSSSHHRGEGTLLWSPGYNDRILKEQGQLQRWMDYLNDNPRRLLLKRQHPDLFRVQQSLTFGSHSYSAIGNCLLLERPYKLQLQCSRSLTTEQIESRKAWFLQEAEAGAVVITPSISPGEKAITRALFEARCPLVLLVENGFTHLTKPGGRLMDACAAGRLLILAPWAHHNERQTISRAQCLNLNGMATELVKL